MFLVKTLHAHQLTAFLPHTCFIHAVLLSFSLTHTHFNQVDSLPPYCTHSFIHSVNVMFSFLSNARPSSSTLLHCAAAAVQHFLPLQLPFLLHAHTASLPTPTPAPASISASSLTFSFIFHCNNIVYNRAFTTALSVFVVCIHLVCLLYVFILAVLIPGPVAQASHAHHGDVSSLSHRSSSSSSTVYYYARRRRYPPFLGSYSSYVSA